MSSVNLDDVLAKLTLEEKVSYIMLLAWHTYTVTFL
jgi:hypothetical protein